MKKIILLLLLTPILSFNVLQTKVDIVGKWSGEDKKEIGTFIFDSEGYAKIDARGKIIGGKNFNMGGISAKMTYNYRANKNPVEIDIIISEIEGKHLNTIYLFAEFIDNDTMKAGFLRDKNDPKEFTDDNSIILNRVK